MQEAFADFFRAFLTLKQRAAEAGRELRMHELTAYLVFTINIFQSLEDEMVRGQVLKLVSLPLWQALSPGRLQLELHALPTVAKHWKSLLKREQKVWRGLRGRCLCVWVSGVLGGCVHV